MSIYGQNTQCASQVPVSLHTVVSAFRYTEDDDTRCTYLVFSRTNFENRVGTPLDTSDSGLLKCIDNRKIEQSGIVRRSVWILDGDEVSGVGRQVAKMYVSLRRGHQPGIIIVLFITSSSPDHLLSYWKFPEDNGMNNSLVLAFESANSSAHIYALFEIRR